MTNTDHSASQEKFQRNCALLVLSAAALLTWFVNWPGHYSVDSIIQLTEGVTGYFFSFNPPFMSVVLGAVTRIFGHGAFMLMSSGFLFFAWFLFLSEKSRLPGLLVGVLLPVLLLNPVILIYNGTVWKDVFYANLILLSFALASRAHALFDKAFCGSIICAGFAVLVRQQGIIGLICVCILLGYRVSSGVGAKRLYALVPFAAAIGVAVAGSWAVGLVQRETTVDPTGAGFGVVARYDIAGMLVHDPLSLVPILQRHGLNGDAVSKEAKKGYSAERVDTLTDAYGKLIGSLGSANTIALWEDLAMTSPTALLKHKWNAWMELEGSRQGNKCLPAFVGVAQDTPGIMVRIGVPYRFPSGYMPVPSPYSTRLYRYAQSGIFMFTGMTWLLLNVINIAIGVWRRNGVVVALCLAGTLHALSFFAVSIACDFRYQYLTVVTALTGFLLLMCRTTGAASNTGAH